MLIIMSQRKEVDFTALTINVPISDLKLIKTPVTVISTDMATIMSIPLAIIVPSMIISLTVKSVKEIFTTL